jgi:hypothetical protein
MCEQSVDILDYFECLSAICENAKTEFQNISTTPSGTITDFLKDIGNLQLQILAFKVPYASLVIDVRTTGGDYRFANGVSVFMPWSLLALSMSLPRYAELNFIKDTTAGQYWVFYVLVQLILEARPPISILQPPPILTARDYETMKTKNVTAITSKTLLNPTIKMSSIDILDAINLILDPNGTGQGVKDNPPRSKGTDEHIEYFRTVKNFWPPLKP